MGAVQRLATVVIVGLVAIATLLVLYLADENNRIQAEEESQRDAAVERATTNFIQLCVQCHGPGGEGLMGADAKFADGSSTGRIGLPTGGNTYATELNQHGSTNGTPWPGATEDGISFPSGFAGRTDWIRHRITYGKLNPDGTYRMPPFGQQRGGPLSDAQIDEMVQMYQYGDWNHIYNQAIEEFGGYPTPGPAPTIAGSAASAGAAAQATSAPAAEAEPGAGTAAYEIDMVDILFEPTELTIPANTDVTIKLVNNGASQHQFKIDALGIDSGLVDPGQTAEITINAPEGVYDYHCPVPGHTEAGMVGKLTVAADAPPPAGAADGSSGEAPAAEPTAPAAPPQEATTVEVGMVDILFEPAEISIPADTDVTLHLVNNGATQHQFKIDALGIDSGLVDPGASVDITVNAPAGSYEYHCPVPGHTEAGMVGTLTVQ